MKNIILVLASLGFAIAGCSSIAKYEESNQTPNGIKVFLGQDENIHVGDKISLVERKCRPMSHAELCGYKEVGKLTVREVHEEYSLVVPDGNIVFKEGQYFKFATHCEKKPELCDGSEQQTIKK